MATGVEAKSVEPVPPSEPEANKLFRMVMKHKGSDLHLKVGLPPAMRLTGVIRQMSLPPLTTADMERLMFPLLSTRQRAILVRGAVQPQETLHAKMIAVDQALLAKGPLLAKLLHAAMRHGRDCTAHHSAPGLPHSAPGLPGEAFATGIKAQGAPMQRVSPAPSASSA